MSTESTPNDTAPTMRDRAAHNLDLARTIAEDALAEKETPSFTTVLALAQTQALIAIADALTPERYVAWPTVVNDGGRSIPVPNAVRA